jgi:hypothetical protein
MKETLRPDIVDDGMRLRHMRASAVDRFLTGIGAEPQAIAAA